jgi:hypothetical protein
MMSNRKAHLRQFESVSIPIQISMMKANGMAKANKHQEIRLTLEDKLIALMNN